MNGPVKKINILDNIDRSSVCLTAVVIFARLRWWGTYMRTCTHVALAAVKHLSYTNSFSRFTTYDDCCSSAAAAVLWVGGTGGDPFSASSSGKQ